MNRRWLQFWLLGAPLALAAALGAFVAAQPSDPFAALQSEEVVDRYVAGRGREVTERNVHADVLALAGMDGIGRAYAASATSDRRGIVLTSRDPEAAVPTIVLRPGRMVESANPRGVASGGAGRGWCIVTVATHAGPLTPLENRIRSLLRPKRTLGLAGDERYGAGLAITGFLARRNFR